jgi:hypothetical protein
MLSEGPSGGKETETLASVREHCEEMTRALKETVSNLERVVEEGERALKRARSHLERLGIED